jgi:hypothetical protein
LVNQRKSRKKIYCKPKLVRRDKLVLWKDKEDWSLISQTNPKQWGLKLEKLDMKKGYHNIYQWNSEKQEIFQKYMFPINCKSTRDG